MAQRRATTAANLTKNLVESAAVPLPPPLFSSPKCSRDRVGGGCTVQSCCSKRIFSQNNANFERSGVPARFMYYRNNSWMNFSADVVEKLRPGFLERKSKIVVSIDGAEYVVDLERMLQIDVQTGNFRSISWIDVNGKCFFPNPFFSEEEIIQSKYGKESNCNPKIEIEVKIDRNALKRKREEEDEVSSSCKAVEQDGIKHQRLEARVAKWPNTKLLTETEIEYLLVKGHFLNGIRRVDEAVRINSIHQCNWEEHLDKARLAVFQKQNEITKAARGTSNMVYAWYGASAKVVGSILLGQGFGLPCKVPGAGVYGIGVYLSPVGLPHLSAKLADADDNGIRHLILCRVVLGNVEKVELGSQQCRPSSADFDTGSDDPKNPRWYVVWSTNANMHILPEFIVSFKPSGNMEGQPKPVIGVKYSLEKLFLKLRSSLPPAKVEEILISYMRYKDGTVPKDVFIRKLRLDAGDEVLRSAIQEMNAFG